MDCVRKLSREIIVERGNAQPPCPYFRAASSIERRRRDSATKRHAYFLAVVFSPGRQPLRNFRTLCLPLWMALGLARERAIVVFLPAVALK